MSSGEIHKKPIEFTEKHITDLGFLHSSTKMLEPNHVLIALAGQGKTRGSVTYNTLPLCTNQSIAAIKCDSSKLNYKYLYYLLHNDYDKIRDYSSGDGRGGLNLQMIREYPIKIANNIANQSETAELLSQIDNLIQLQDDKIMQLTYSRSQYVKDHYSNAYEREPIGFSHFLEESKSPKASEIEIGKILRLGLHLKGLSTVTTNSTISLDKTNYYIRSEGDLIYGKQNIFNGSIAIIPEIYDGYLSSGDVPTLKFIGKKVNKYYFLEYLKQKRIYNKLEIYAIGTGSKRLHIPELLKLKFFIPPIEEQSKVVCILSQMDNSTYKTLYNCSLLFLFRKVKLFLLILNILC